MKAMLLFAFIILQHFLGYSQIVFNGVDQNKQNKLIQLREFFVSRVNIDFGNDSGVIKTDLLRIYDTAINTFFNYEQMTKDFKDNKGGYNPEAYKYFQYKALNGIDQIVDYVPEDSIVVMNKKDYLLKYEPLTKIDSTQLANFFLGGFIIKGDYYPLIEIKFDNEDKLVFIMPMIYFEPDKSDLIHAFLERQKN